MRGSDPINERRFVDNNRMYTPAVEDYLKAVWMLQQSQAPVSTSRISERLGVSAGAVTAMVKRLAEQALLRHEPYYGVELTAAGELESLRVIRRHRILELFLTEVLSYEWDQVHEEAERLEHAVSDQMIERLALLLDNPQRDPHGSAIPTVEGEVDPVVFPTLADAAPGVAGRVVKVSVQDPEHLRCLGSLDLYPGARVAVVDRATIEGSIPLIVNGALRTLSRELAEQVHMAPDADGTEAPMAPAAPPRSPADRTL